MRDQHWSCTGLKRGHATVKSTYKEYHHRCSSQVESNRANIGQEEHATLGIFLEGCDSLITFLYTLRAVYCRSIDSVQLEYLKRDENDPNNAGPLV